MLTYICFHLWQPNHDFDFCKVQEQQEHNTPWTLNNCIIEHNIGINCVSSSKHFLESQCNFLGEKVKPRFILQNDQNQPKTCSLV